ncbi:hypothetical protein [Oligoflexus tunisiensis]|uniref:hypothetical protein n=1 Tax=Oligoflexus tunisiensis TaxID=708132 RepID=UPI00114CB336|nr:hypothetical protein [Oligoflexus tunisiensis]
MKIGNILSALISLSFLSTTLIAADFSEKKHEESLPLSESLHQGTNAALEMGLPHETARAVDNKICFFNDWESRDDIAQRLGTYDCRFSYPYSHGTMYCTLKEC